MTSTKTVQLDEKQHRKLKLLAVEQGSSINEVVFQALSAFLLGKQPAKKARKP